MKAKMIVSFRHRWLFVIGIEYFEERNISP